MFPQTPERKDLPEMTVIFRHAAAYFKLDSRIRFDAIYIKEPGFTDPLAVREFYFDELARTSNAMKSFIVMNYTPFIGSYFDTLISGVDKPSVKNWHFISFFHDDSETLLVKHKKSIDILDLKTSLLLNMQNYPFIKRFALPLGHTLTFHDIMPIILKNWGYEV